MLERETTLKRRTFLGVSLGAITAALTEAGIISRVEAKRACRVQGHPCLVGGQACCPVAGKVVEYRVTGPGAVTRCAVVGEPDPPPVDPPGITPIPNTEPSSS